MIFQSELTWAIIVVIITSLVIVYSIYYTSYFSSKTHEISRSIVFDDIALRLIAILYVSKFQPVDKTYLQMMIDSLLSSRRNNEEFVRDIVYYGKALGTYRVSDIIFPIFDNFIGKNRWQLVIYYKSSKIYDELYYIYGYDILDNRKSNIKSYVLTIPIPDGEVGYIVLRVV